MEKILSFTDLVAWKEGHNLVLQIYHITKGFPANEKFGLATQLNRAAVSVTSNIAEGFCRSSKKEKRNFYFIANSSLTETQNQVLIAKDLSYITREDSFKIWNQTITVQKLISGLIRSAVSRDT
jgi:four helix bundle protein